MIIKDFEGATIADAMKSVKGEFGPNAIILSTREREMNDGSAKFYSIKAASTHQRSSAIRSEELSAGPSNATFALGDAGKYGSVLSQIYDCVANDKRLDGVESKLTELSTVCFELLDLVQRDSTPNLPTRLRKIYNRLLVAGIEKKYLSELVAFLEELKVQETSIAEGRSVEDYFLSKSIKWIGSKIKGLRVSPETSKIHFFLGPPGAGKSTAVTKFSELARSNSHSVLIVTMDSTGVSQFESVKTYSKIVDMPVINVISVKELLDVLATNQGYDYVVVDNAGGTPFVQREETAIRKFSETEFPIDFHLVISLAEKLSLNDLFVRRSFRFGVSSIMFSKLDYVQGWGDIFNLAVRWSLPVSYLSFGPDLSTDFEPLNKEKLIGNYFSV